MKDSNESAVFIAVAFSILAVIISTVALLKTTSNNNVNYKEATTISGEPTMLVAPFRIQDGNEGVAVISINNKSNGIIGGINELRVRHTTRFITAQYFNFSNIRSIEKSLLKSLTELDDRVIGVTVYQNRKTVEIK